MPPQNQSAVSPPPPQPNARLTPNPDSYFIQFPPPNQIDRSRSPPAVPAPRTPQGPPPPPREPQLAILGVPQPRTPPGPPPRGQKIARHVVPQPVTPPPIGAIADAPAPPRQRCHPRHIRSRYPQPLAASASVLPWTSTAAAAQHIRIIAAAVRLARVPALRSNSSGIGSHLSHTSSAAAAASSSSSSSISLSRLTSSSPPPPWRMPTTPAQTRPRAKPEPVRPPQPVPGPALVAEAPAPTRRDLRKAAISRVLGT